MRFVIYELDSVVEDNADAGEVFIKPVGMEFAAVSGSERVDVLCERG